MRIEDIKNDTIKTLIEEAHNGSMTIGSDLEDAISNSNTEDELISNWQSALEGLKHEVEGYWSRLEGMKCTPQVSDQVNRRFVDSRRRILASL